MSAGGPALAEKRVALLVGNSAYQNVTRLDDPQNDAMLLAATLGSPGLALIGCGQLELDKSTPDNAVQNFLQQIQGADVALFYYAGRGVAQQARIADQQGPDPSIRSTMSGCWAR